MIKKEKTKNKRQNITEDTNNFKLGDTISSGDNTGKYKRGKNSYDFDQYEYNLIDDVYMNIRDTSRVIFITRHAERGWDYSQDGGLVEHGIEQALDLGKRLTGGRFKDTTYDFYGSTHYKRTVETSYYLGYSRGYSKFHEGELFTNEHWMNYNKVIHPIDAVNYNYFDHLTGKVFEEAVLNMANDVCNLTKGHPFSFITSHDHFVIPLIRWVTEETIKFTLETWVNYLSGIVIIVNDKMKEWEMYPIRTLKERTMVLLD